MRGNVRKMVWQHAADAVDDLPDVAIDSTRHEDEAIPPTDARMTALYRATRAALVKWMRARGRGVMGPPPGGVGTR